MTKLTKGTNLSFLHPYFRRICQQLPFYPESESPLILSILHKYAMKYLIYSEGDKTDLETLKETCEDLLYSSNPALFLESLKFFMQLEDKELIKKCVPGCLRFMNSSSEIKLIFLNYVVKGLKSDRRAFQGLS
jgi:hypothetical protein